ncbi:MAG: M23 family metallopeptidase [Patescibacteria group bacterium]|nr:M23 family metallopeptidase [Patescibacteria group bacterium]
MGVSISSKTPSPFWIAIGIHFFRIIRATKKALEYFFVKIIFEALRPIGRIVLRFFILPIYTLFVMSRLKINRLALPARGFALFLVTNKYLFHFSLILAATGTVYTNLQTQQALAHDAGQQSLLYTMMTNGETEIVKEEIRFDETTPDSQRLAMGTIEAIPHIDFDYSNDEDDSLLSNQQMPGTLVLRPIDQEEEAKNNVVKRVRSGVETYTVKAGDSLGTIARDHDIDVGTILFANNLSERQYIRPGDQLKILPVSGVLVAVKSGDTLGAIASKYNGDLEEIMTANQLADEIVPVGKELIIPGGEPPKIVQERVIAVSRDQLREPGVTQYSAPSASNVNVNKPADVTEQVITTKLLWPTSGHVITQYYGWRHTGLDIDGDYTSPLYASEDGVVEISGWNSGGYGLQVLIRHPNGMKTRYAHASKLFVKAGDAVKRGQVIAMMGSTGRSTGSHIHYEVIVNGSKVNPLLYIR